MAPGRGLPGRDEVHVWRVSLDAGGPGEAGERRDANRASEHVMRNLPAVERARAARILPPPRRLRWVASRWSLRDVLAGYLGEEPAAVELVFGRHGKPRLAGESPLRFSLSHSGGLALIAVATEREVGVDLERVGRRPSARPRPRAYYEEWTRREALGKCFGGGLAEPPPRPPARVVALDLGEGWAAALAVAGTAEPRLRRFELASATTAVSAATANL
ncbi:MAG TPA: hypothetical protein VGB06_01630 [Solirubrobacterales bacterium]|jgi:phosphopantetheinyl transferase